jgi:iron complex outermembrane receptor protein
MQMVSYKTGLPFYFNGAKAELYGLDADFSIRPAQRLTLHAGASLLKTKFKSFPNADITTPAPGGGTVYDVGSVKGNELPVAPDWTLNASADYVLPTSVGDVAFNVTYLHNDGWFGEPDNRLRQPAYDVLNAQVSWTSSDELTLIRLWGRNLTDEDYAATLFSQFNGDVIQYTPPRTYGVTVERRF